MNTQEELRGLIEHATKNFTQFSDEAWSTKPAPEKWSKKEILGHLIDSALTNLRRFVMTQYLQEQNIVYHQDEWVVLQHYQQADTAELIALWQLLNKQIIRVTSQIPQEKMQNLCDTGKYGSSEKQTLDFLISDYNEHMKHHLRAILEDPTL